MKGLVADLLAAGSVLFLAFLSAPARADIVYWSDPNSIEMMQSSGVETTFATVGLDKPHGLAFSSSGVLYVANFGGNSIEMFARDGSDLGPFAKGKSVLSGPDGIAFDSAGNLYVANQKNNTVEEFSTTGVASVFVSPAAGLNAPSALAFDSFGNLWVANTGGNSVCEFLSTGAAASTYLGFSQPDGLAFDDLGNLWVSNFGSKTITEVPNGLVFSGAGRANGLAFDSSGDLLAANQNGIAVFGPLGFPEVFAATGTGETPDYLAVTTDGGQPLLWPAPEPGGGLLLALGSGVLMGRHRHRRA